MSQLVDDAVAAYRQRLEDALVAMGAARDAEAFCAAERGVVELAQQLASDMTQRVLQQVSDDRLRRKEALERVRGRAAAKGIDVRVERVRRTEVRTLGGKLVTVLTPYATAAPRGDRPLARRGSQGTGVYPVLDQLGICGRSTPGARLRVSRAVCEANSVSSARDLLAGGGIAIDHKAALRLTYMVCDDALRARTEAMRATQTGNEQGVLVGRRVVVAVDGGRVNIRKRVAGRPRKGGRKRFETDWREPKVLTVYVVGEDGKRDRTIASVIDATLGDADAVFRLARYHLLRLGAHKAAELTLIGDGAPWIWNRAEWLREALGLAPEQFNQIFDYFHVVERLGELSKTQSRWGEEGRLAWLQFQKARLKAGKIEEIEAVVQTIAERLPEDMRKEWDYWSSNCEKMRYGAFRERRLPIGSGAVESSVRRVINLRMKGASITWTEEHAEGILHLRAHAKSGRWSELEHAVLQITGWRPTARRARRAP
ncbi:MAG: hypothetical protein R3F59_23535 [Myxococcota bacterium]